MTVFRTVLVCAVLAAGVCGAAGDAKAKTKKPKVYDLMPPANALITEAQEAYVNGDAKAAIDLFRQAHESLSDIEAAHPAWAASTEFAPIRMRKALCETEIDRIMLEDAQAVSRTIVVTDTAELEKKRAERKRQAEADAPETAPVKLGTKNGGAAADDDAEGEEAAEDGPVNVGEELDFAKDMIQIDRFEAAEGALVKVLRADHANRDARFLMALSRLQQGRQADALVALDDLLADDAADEPALLLAAGAYMATGAYNKAIDALDRAMKASPKRPDACLNMAWLLLEMRPDDTSEAELYYRQAVKMGAARARDLERRLGIRQE